MKRQRKQAIKKLYKKSIFPAIFLLLIFLAIYAYAMLALVFYFEQYIIEQKVSAIHEEADYWGNMILQDFEGEDIIGHISSLEKFLQEENDICITDEAKNILKSLKNTTPVLNNLCDTNLKLYADADTKNQYESLIEALSVKNLKRQLAEIMTAEDINDENWLAQNVFSGNYWVEIPVHIDNYHLYYRAPIILSRNDSCYILTLGGEILIPLLIPVILLVINVISSIQVQRRMLHLLYMDSVTGGKNFLYFVQQGTKILHSRKKTRNSYAIVNLHLKRYQEYCLCYGNASGEELLKSIDALLQVQLTKQEPFARFSKADFALLLKIDSVEQCNERLKMLLSDLANISADRTLTFQAGLYSIDLAKLRKENKKGWHLQLDIEQFYHYANAARVTIHEQEGESIKLFDNQILEEQMWKHKVEDTMEAALHNKEFQLYLQPKYNPNSNKMVGAEALVRWISPTEGMIPPNRFIPIFEENGFITRLDDYMISAVAQFQSERKKQGKKPLIISVNVSRANFAKDNLSSHICRLIDAYGAEHSGIELEVTESAFFGDKTRLQKILTELKDLGFRISMDDFGAGYSSLNSLKELPIDVLKLDMEFFRGEDTEKRGEIVVKEAIQLAKNLNMEVVAEGIEKKEQVEFLASQNCDMIQGYYYAKPMPVAEFEERAQTDA